MHFQEEELLCHYYSCIKASQYCYKVHNSHNLAWEEGAYSELPPYSL